MDNYHLTKSGGSWRLRKQGSEEDLVTASTKDEAVHKTQDYMSDKQGSVKIHSSDGRITDERTYPRSIDPRRSKG
jgi:hypothetical protein